MIENRILDTELEEIKRKPLNLAVLALILIGIGGLFGATTNFINGNISEEYFRRIMNWEFSGIWIAAIFQGLFEGLIHGVILSFIFTIGFATITKMKADWKFTKKQSTKIILTAYGCWVLGGIIAVILAFILPNEYDRLIYAVPKEPLPRLGYAWVGGSIWGGMAGGIISVIYGLINTNKEWKKKSKYIRHIKVNKF